MEVAHSDHVETDGMPPTHQPAEFLEQLAGQHPAVLEADQYSVEPESCVDTGDDLIGENSNGDTVDRAGVPLGESGGSQLLIDNQVVTLRHKKTETEPAIIPALRDSIPSQDLGDPLKFRPTGFSSMRNGRRRMEDRHVILHDLAAHLPENLRHKIQPEENVSFYAVYDGHAGMKAAACAASNLHIKLVESTNYPENVDAAIQDAIIATDNIICKDLSHGNCGTTVVLAFIKDGSLHCAWVGDSEAVLGRQGNHIRLVDSHRPDRLDEKERIEVLGGYVSYWGTWRVNGTMAVSRAIGDESLKPFLSTECDVTTVKILPTDDFIIIACDGLWDYLKREDAVQMVYSAISEQNFNPDKLADLAEKLNLSSQEKGSSDNISTIIVFLRPIQDIRKDMENPLIMENILEGIISTSSLITDPQLVRKSLNPSEHLPPWGKESTSPTPESTNQASIGITPDSTPKLVNGVGGMFSPDPFSALGQQGGLGNMSGMLQPNSSGMEQFGQTTIDDFRPSISPVIPDVSFDQVDGINSDSPVKVDSGFISPKKDMENEEVSELMAHAQIQRVDQLLQLYNTEDDSPTPDEEKSLEEILAERRGVQEDAMPTQDDSEDEDEDGEVEAVELEDASSEGSDDFAKVLVGESVTEERVAEPEERVVIRESLPEESGCLVPPTSTLPTSQESELVTLEDLSPSPNVIPEVNENMEASELTNSTKENPPTMVNNNNVDLDQNNDQLIGLNQNNDQLFSVDQITDQLSDLASERNDNTINLKNKPETENNIAGEYRDKKDSASDSLLLTDGDQVLDTSNINGSDNGPESISFELTDTNQGFMLKTPGAEEQNLANFDPDQTPELQTNITPNIASLNLSESQGDVSSDLVEVHDNKDIPHNEGSSIQVNEVTPDVCVIEDTNTTADTNDVDREVAEVNCSLSIPSLNIIPSTPVRSLSPIHPADGDSIQNGEKENIETEIPHQDVNVTEEAESASQQSGVDSDASSVASSLPSAASIQPADKSAENDAAKSAVADISDAAEASEEVKTETCPPDTKETIESEVKSPSKPVSPAKKAVAGKTSSKTGSVAPASGAVKAKTTKTVDSKVKTSTEAVKRGADRPGSGADRPGSGRTATGTATSKNLASAKTTAAATKPLAKVPAVARAPATSKTTTSATTRTRTTTAPATTRISATKTGSTTTTGSRPGAAIPASRTGSSAAASRATSSASSRTGSGKGVNDKTVDGLEAKGMRKPLTKPGSAGSTRAHGGVPIAARLAGASKTRAAPVGGAASKPGEAPGSPTKTAAKPAPRPGVTRPPVTSSVPSVRRTQSLRKTDTSSAAAKERIAARSSADKDRIANRVAAIPRPPSKAAANKGENPSLNSRPLTSTEARKPTEAAARVAAARAAAKKSTLPRKPKNGANTTKSNAESPVDDVPPTTNNDATVPLTTNDATVPPTTSDATVPPTTNDCPDASGNENEAVNAVSVTENENHIEASANPIESLVVEGQSLESSTA